MSGTWYSGTVKEVVDGATIVVMGNVASGPPPEKRIILSSLVAPRMVTPAATCAALMANHHRSLPVMSISKL